MHDRHQNRGIEATLFWAFVLWLAWLPLPIGSNRPVWVGVALLGLAVLAGLWLLAWMAGRVETTDALRAARWPLGLLGAFLAWQFAQRVSPGVLAAGSVRDAFAAAGATSHGLSLDPSASLEQIFEGLLLTGAFAMTLLLVRSRRDQRRLLWALVWIGVVMAVVTSVTALEGWQIEVFGVSVNSRASVSGTFVNRNHFANYLVLALAGGIGLLITLQENGDPVNWRARLRQWAETLLGPKARLRVFLALMVISLVLTRSRMGNTALFASLLLAGGLALVLLRGRQRPLFVLIASLVAIDIFLVGTWFGVEQVVERIQQTVTVTGDQWTINEPGRMEANREGLDMIRTAPWTGMGGGAWFTAFPQWRAWNHGFFDHAHNDYIQFAVEYGIPATLLLGLFVLLCAGRAVTQLATRQDRLILGAAFAALMGAIAMGIHASVEFNLQIPANAVTFLVLLALPWLHGENSSRARRSGNLQPRRAQYAISGTANA